MSKIVSASRKRLKAYLAHAYTATGIIWAFLAASSLLRGEHAESCLWLMVAMAVDSTDGFLARHWQVKEVLPHIDGRKLDDIVDYLNYTFLPVVLIVETARFPEPLLLWAGLPLVTSLFAFCNKGIKEEKAGFFLGFPSYWNVVAVYVVLWLDDASPFTIATITLLFSLLTLIPLRFVYPSHAPRWAGFFVGGAAGWLALICLMLVLHPRSSPWLIQISLLYPALYLLLSTYLDFKSRKTR